LEKRDIKILHTEWSDGWGGQEIRIIAEMKAAQNYGVYVALACREESKISSEAKKLGFDVFHLPFSSSYDLASIVGIVKLIKEYSFDIVNTHGGKDTWCGGLAAKIAGAKFIRSRHLSNPINSSRLNFINELADYIITTGEGVKEAMIKNNRINPNIITSIPTGVDTKVFDPNIYDKAECRAHFGLPKNKRIIGNLGVLRGFKRQDVFIEIAKEFYDTMFVIAGEGPQRQNLERIIKENQLEEKVLLLGHTNEPAKFLKCLDIFLLTSDCNEGVPQSLMQALAMELPCIAADIGSVRDLHYANNFVMLDSWSKDGYIDAIKNRLGEIVINRAFIEGKFDSTAMNNALCEVYEKVIKL
jgi:glycosyltransferase involved in cell wall biosynthesis